MAKFKVWAISLLYNDAEIMIESLDQYRKTSSPDVETQHVLVWQHWPVDKENVKLKMMEWAQDHGAIWIDPGKNIGLHKGFNLALDSVSIPENALVIGYDPDCYPVTPGWDLAMCKLYMSDPSIVWMSLWHQHAYRELVSEGRGGPIESVNGVNIRRLKSPALNSVCGFRKDWLSEAGGLEEGNPFYGGLEVFMWQRIPPGGWAFMPGYCEEPYFYDRINPLYRAWKWKTCHTREIPATTDFETWLKETGKL